MRRLDITVAYPARGLTYVFVSLLSYYLLKETLDIWRIADSAVILFGMLLLAVGGSA